MWMYTPYLLHAQLGKDKNKLSVKYEYFCNHYGGPWGKYSIDFFLGFQSRFVGDWWGIQTVLKAPSHLGMKGISQFNSYISLLTKGIYILTYSMY